MTMAQNAPGGGACKTFETPLVRLAQETGGRSYCHRAPTAGLSIHSPVESPASELRCILFARQVHLLGTLIVARIGVFKNGGIPA